MSMFQIQTQKNWIEVMHITMVRTGERIAPLVAIFFILYHVFVTLVSDGHRHHLGLSCSVKLLGVLSM